MHVIRSACGLDASRTAKFAKTFLPSFATIYCCILDLSLKHFTDRRKLKVRCILKVQHEPVVRERSASPSKFRLTSHVLRRFIIIVILRKAAQSFEYVPRTLSALLLSCITLRLPMAVTSRRGGCRRVEILNTKQNSLICATRLNTNAV